MLRQFGSSLFVTSVFCLANLLGCDSIKAVEDEATNTDAGTSGSSTTRTQRCLELLDAFCDYYSDKCLQRERTDCDSYYQSLYCRDDEKSLACSSALTQGTCDALPQACGGVFDTAPALSQCNAFVDLVCKRLEGCGVESYQECLSATANSLDCNRAVGIKAGYDQCMIDIQAVACDYGDTISNCAGVITIK